MPNECPAQVKGYLRKIGVSENWIWRIDQARNCLATMSNFPLPDFTLHNQVHSDNIIQILDSLNDEFAIELNSQEANLLAISAYLHDLGMFFSPAEFKARFLGKPESALDACPLGFCDDIVEHYELHDKPVEEQIREVHNLLSAFMLDRRPFLSNILERGSRPYIMNICRGHRKTNLREKRCTCYQDGYFGNRIRVGLLASLLRLADALDFYNNRAPYDVFVERQYDFLNNPTALEHWLRHYFVTEPHICHLDDGLGPVLKCIVYFTVPKDSINGQTYLDFFRPLFQEHTDALKDDLNIDLYPPVFVKTLGVTGMEIDFVDSVRGGVDSLPDKILERIQESKCKNIIDFVQWRKKDLCKAETRPKLAQYHVPLENPFGFNVPYQAQYFCNRRSEIEFVLDCIKKWKNVHIAGARRIGKTWLLHHISCPDVLQAHGMDLDRNLFVYVYCRSNPERKQDSQFYRELSQTITDSARRANLDFGSDLDGIDPEREFKQLVQAISAQGTTIVLLLDEFETLVARKFKLGIDFFQKLQELWEDPSTRLVYITASYPSLDDLFSGYQFTGSSFFDVFERRQLGLFDEQDSRNLVVSLWQRSRSALAEKLLKLILDMGGGYPFFLQMAGEHAFDMLRTGQDPLDDDGAGFLDDVSKAAVDHLRYYWNQLDERAQQVLTLLPSANGLFECKKELRRLQDQCLVVRRDGQYQHFSVLLRKMVVSL